MTHVEDVAARGNQTVGCLRRNSESVPQKSSRRPTLQRCAPHCSMPQLSSRCPHKRKGWLRWLLNICHCRTCNAVTEPSPQPLRCPSLSNFWAEKFICTPANSTFSSPITNLMTTLCDLVKIISCANAKRKQKGLRFQISYSSWLFSNGTMAVEGLTGKSRRRRTPHQGPPLP